MGGEKRGRGGRQGERERGRERKIERYNKGQNRERDTEEDVPIEINANRDGQRLIRDGIVEDPLAGTRARDGLMGTLLTRRVGRYGARANSHPFLETCRGHARPIAMEGMALPPPPPVVDVLRVYCGSFFACRFHHR